MDSVKTEIVRSNIVVTTPRRFHDDLAAIDEVDVVYPLPCGLHFESLTGGAFGLDASDAVQAHELLLEAMFGRSFQPA